MKLILHLHTTYAWRLPSGRSYGSGVAGTGGLECGHEGVSVKFACFCFFLGTRLVFPVIIVPVDSNMTLNSVLADYCGSRLRRTPPIVEDADDELRGSEGATNTNTNS